MGGSGRTTARRRLEATLEERRIAPRLAYVQRLGPHWYARNPTERLLMADWGVGRSGGTSSADQNTHIMPPLRASHGQITAYNHYVFAI